MRRGIAVAAVLIASALGATAACANEAVPSGRAPVPPSDGGAASGPRVWIIGDSLTDDVRQRQIFNGNFGWMGWRLHIEASAGATMREHWQTDRANKWNTFARAAKSDAQVIIVELGTNDAALFAPQDTANLNLTLNYLRYTTNWLRANAPNKCIIQMGVDDTGGSAILTPTGWRPYLDGYTGIYFNTTAKAQAYGNVHFADYAAKLVTDPPFKDGIYRVTATQPDTIHPKTEAAKQTFSVWMRDQVRGSCPGVWAAH